MSQEEQNVEEPTLVVTEQQILEEIPQQEELANVSLVEQANTIQKKEKLREIGAICCFVVACSIVLGVLLTSYFTVSILLTKQLVTAEVLYIVVGSRAIISATLLGFAYYLMRVAERLLIPRHLMVDSKGVEVIRTLLGNEKDVAKPASAYLSLASKHLPPIVESVTKLISSVKDEVKK